MAKLLSLRCGLLLRIGLSSVVYSASANLGYALVFNFNPAPGTPAAALIALQIAGARWSTSLTDPVVVNLDFSFTALGSMTRASTSPSTGTVSYTNFRNTLAQDRTSSSDNIAVANLPLSSIAMMLNRTSDSPHGAGSSLPYLDNNGSINNTTVRTTYANAKALGLLPANSPAVDAIIRVNSSIMWDFDLSNGLAPGSSDFLGTATHEIGHALGFVSGVSSLDASGPVAADDVTLRVWPLDLFRFSQLSAENNAIDWTADTRAKSFSIDRGVTMGPLFSTGVTFGDGAEASHWKDNLGLGLMDPTASISEIRTISENDLRAMDAIGWNRVPDAGSSIVLLALALAIVAGLNPTNTEGAACSKRGNARDLTE